MPILLLHSVCTAMYEDERIPCGKPVSFLFLEQFNATGTIGEQSCCTDCFEEVLERKCRFFYHGALNWFEWFDFRDMKDMERLRSRLQRWNARIEWTDTLPSEKDIAQEDLNEKFAMGELN